MHGDAGGDGSLNEVMPLVYNELHRLASVYMRNERHGHTLQPTALVNEAYLRLLGQHSVNFANRAQVLGVAAQLMRRILSAHAERRSAEKHGGGITMICLSDSPEPASSSSVVYSDVDEALERLAQLDERQAKVVELRIFGGLTVEEIAGLLNISVITVHRDWTTGKIWLARELQAKTT